MISHLLTFATVVAVSMLIIGPIIGVPIALFMLPVATAQLKSLGIPVGRSFRKLNPVDARTPHDRETIKRHSDELGHDSVLLGRALAIGILPTLYLTAAVPGASLWWDGWLFIPIWLISRDRILFPLVVIAAQLCVQLWWPR